jgi:RNA polymerase sigma-70 factor (ECF subfamily)
MNARRTAGQIACNSYGRLIAYLAARTKDLAAAEDALGDAFLAALNTWPEKGVPQNPEAWLLVTARHRLIDMARRHQFQEKVFDQLKIDDMRSQPELDLANFPDDRLKLMFVCAHPAIDASIHTPLMLQTVLGLNAAQIASAFLVAPAAMGQRLVRAKAKIRDAGIDFELPAIDHMGDRLNAVLEAIYAAYTVGWDSIAGSNPRPKGLTEEAIWLARMTVTLLPGAPEAKGLLALLLFCEARRHARRDPDGCFVPISEQDMSLWSQPMLNEADDLLKQASVMGRTLGRFQLEAAIQSAHVWGRLHNQNDWEALILLYEGLLQAAPTIGALVNQAAAIAEGRGFAAGLAALNQIPRDAVKNYQPYWSLQAHLLHKGHDISGAKAAYQKAIGLTEDASVREYLIKRLLECTPISPEPESQL